MKPQLNLKMASVACLAVFVLAVGSYGQSSVERGKSQPKESISPTPAIFPSPTPNPDNKPIFSPIPLTQVVDRAEESNRLVQEVNDRISRLPDPDAEGAGLRSRQESLSSAARETERVLSKPTNLNELWRQEQRWNGHEYQYLKMRNFFVARANALAREISLLESRQGDWSATLQQTEETDDLKEVFDQIRSSLNKIQSVLATLKDRQRSLVVNENLVFQQERITASILRKIKQTRLDYQGSLLARDHYPLWDYRAYRDTYQTLKFNFGDNIVKDIVSSSHHVRMRVSWVIFSLLMTGLLLVVVLKLRSWLKGEVKAGDAKLEILKYPVSLSLPVLLLSIVIFTPNLPLGIINLLSIVLLLPILRITPLLIERRFKPLLNAFLAFFLLDFGRKLITASPITSRIILAIEVAAAIVFFAWSAYKLRLDEVSRWTFAMRAAVPGIWLTISLLAVSLAANMLGGLALSEVLLEGTLFSIYLAVAFLAGVRAAVVLGNLLLASPLTDWLAGVRLYQDGIKYWGGRILTAGAFLVWLVAALEFFTIRDWTLRWLEQTLKRPITIGALTISAWDILLFFLVLFGGLILARIIRLILQDEILVRLPLKYGLPHAISTVTYYIIATAVFLMSLVAVGMELTRFTVLTGALGVGIGIGLQDIANSFVSGIILLFERHIRLGDFVEIEGIKGEVDRIGMISCTILTSQGAEAIIPNAALTANRVLNWTMAHRKRRGELLISVAYGVEIPKVIRILKHAASLHSAISPDPEPVVVFNEFGDGGMQFELRFWLLHDEEFDETRNEVAASVSVELRAEGIEMGVVHVGKNLVVLKDK